MGDFPLPCPALPCPALLCPAPPCPALPCPALTSPATPSSALPDMSNHAKACMGVQGQQLYGQSFMCATMTPSRLDLLSQTVGVSVEALARSHTV